MLKLDDNTAQHHILSIRLAPDGFSFFILNVLDHTIGMFKSSPIAEHQDAVVVALNALRSEEIFSYSFKEVRILIDSTEVTTVPSSLFVDDEKESLFALNVDLSPNDYVLVNHSAAYDLEILFSVQKQLYDFFNTSFARIRFVHNLSLMLQEANAYEAKAQEQLFISYSEHHFTAVALRNSNMIFHNTFSLVTADDLIYFFLLVIQELGFDQYESSAVLTGTIAEDANELQVVRQYLDHLQFSSLPKQCSYCEEIKAFPEHFFANFLALPFCE